MITTQLESFTDSIEELKPILALHHAELAIDPIEIPLDPKWHIYRQRDAAGQIVFQTVRKDGELIAYFIGFFLESIHNDLNLCAQDIFYVVQEHRLGGVGDMLFDAVEAEFRRRGGGRWMVACKTHVPADGFFRRHGFSEIEHSYWKMV
jgi:GNAT superfamily N-acetyltransferase